MYTRPVRQFVPIFILLVLAGLLLLQNAQRWATPKLVYAAETAPQAFGEFVAFCPFSHRAPDDPIVHPNHAGMSHSHDFLGNVTTAATSTVASLVAGASNCDSNLDRSSYWVPTLYAANGDPIAIEHGTFYYTTEIDKPSDLQPIPLGLKIISGDAKATAPPNPGYFKWSCQGAANSSTTDFVVCPVGSKLEMLLNFPDCWDGKNLDSADHKSHMAYNVGGVCPASHPVAVPRLQFKLRYASRGEAGMKLASGAAYTMHGDFFNAWDEAALKNRLECLYQEVKCGPEGFTPANPPAATATATPIPPVVPTATPTATLLPLSTITPTATPVTLPPGAVPTTAIYVPLIRR